MSDHPVVLERRGAIAAIRFNRPDFLNALDLPSALAFEQACRAIEEDTAVRAVILEGAGRAFLAGGDLHALSVDPPRVAQAIIGPMHAGVQVLARLRAPVIGALHGAVAGGGMSVALAPDIAIAADNTRFTMAYVRIGASCDVGASWALPRMVGTRRALELALLGDVIDAQTALSYGLVNRVVPLAALSDEVNALAERLAQGPTQALGQLKRLMRASLGRTLEDQLADEQRTFVEVAATPDCREGMAAFLEKRAPHFTGASAPR